MSDKSSIEWTDATWNPVRGCTKISPGCKNCYASTFAERWRGVPGHPYEQGFDLRLVPEKLGEPLTWKKPRRVFVNSMSDLFQDGIPFEYVSRCFHTMGLCDDNDLGHTFQILTKRADLALDYWKSHARAAWNGPRMNRSANPPRNIWMGVSVEDQKYGLPRIDQLRQINAAIRFISVEPLLEDLGLIDLRGIHWVIIGGESGPGARPLNIQWIRSILQQCRDAKVACFVKQLGRNPFLDIRHGESVERRYFRSSGKGGDMSEWPEDLRVREFPNEVYAGVECRDGTATIEGRS